MWWDLNTHNNLVTSEEAPNIPRKMLYNSQLWVHEKNEFDSKFVLACCKSGRFYSSNSMTAFYKIADVPRSITVGKRMHFPGKVVEE